MKADPASLDELHDIVLPAPIPWWPPAPGWFVLFGVLLCGLFYIVLRYWQRWRANAYRRAALRELKTSNSPAAVSELLRRTALVVAPRQEIATQFGKHWTDWLKQTAPAVMSENVQLQLSSGPYQKATSTTNVDELKLYATAWIERHQIPVLNSH
ncbi:MAG: hypothetical protein CMJ46_00440 [Planctomyces sp.]|nr:hypothetical protein [Planctomyces sp.]